MKILIGILLIILGIALGLYLGIWVMFIGGIIQIIENVTPVVKASAIGLGILRIWLASLVGYVSFYVLFGTGLLMLK